MANQNVRVVVRFRPPNSREKSEDVHTKVDLQYVEDTRVEISMTGMPDDKFNFDHVFKPDTDQENFYRITAKPIIKEVLSGFNGTVFAYGQTGAGKSHCIMGNRDEEESRGVIPRASQDIFDAIEDEDEDTEFKIKVSYLEIYNESIQDLFDTTKRNLKVHESPTRGIYVADLTEYYVSEPDEIYRLLDLGSENKVVAQTKMNAVSSRSHSVFTIHVEQKNSEGSTKNGKFNIVDLAGSEKVGKTGAKGQTLKEAQQINKSLSALGNCINALVEKHSHVPFRNSKLTRILQESLGGNSKTTMICACSPHAFNIEETISTLKFGRRAKSIKNKVKVNARKSAAELEKIVNALRENLGAMKKKNQALQSQVDYLREKAGIDSEELERLVPSEGNDEAEPSPSNETSNDSSRNEDESRDEDRPDPVTSEHPADAVVEKEELKDKHQKELERMQDKLDDAELEKNDLQEEKSKIKQQLEEKEEQLKNIQKELNSIQESSKSEKDDYEFQIEMLEKTLDQRTEEAENLREELDEIKGQSVEEIGQTRQDGAIKEERDTAKAKNEEQQKLIDAQDAELQKIFRELDAAERAKEDAQQLVSDKQEELKVKDQELLSMKALQWYHDFQGSQDELEQGICDIVEQSYNSAIKQIRDEYNQSEQKLLSNLEEDRANFNKTLSQYEEEQKNLEDRLEETKQKMVQEQSKFDEQLLEMAEELDKIESREQDSHDNETETTTVKNNAGYSHVKQGKMESALKEVKRNLREQERKNMSLTQKIESQQERINKLQKEMESMRTKYSTSLEKARSANEELSSVKERLEATERALEAAQQSAKIRKSRIFKPISAKTAKQQFLTEKVEFGQHILRNTDRRKSLW
eukprot:gb/GECH01014465.1/.p1 GENE.gb/GECH01014465.1/~~gb/GECH01014465.1/.p1  ORF type:complete len:867 (+),score=318.12 gb/GECH01014465.1/:1-2601(+)